MEGVRDSALRRELRGMIRDKPESSLFDVRQEAIAWCLEDRPSDTKAVKSRSILCGSVGDEGRNTDSVQDKSSATLDEILKVVYEQGKARS